MNIQPSEHLKNIPPYAFGEITKLVQSLKDKGIKPIDFGVGDPSEPTPDFVINALCEGAKKHASSGYPSYAGSLDFRIAAANYMKANFGVNLNPETEITSTIGSKEAVFNFTKAFVNPGDIVIIPSPGYPPMKSGTLFAEAEPYFVPLQEKNGYLLDYASIPEEIAKKTKIIWINYPNSPTGAVANRTYYEGLINWAHKHNIIIAADEGCYIDIYYEEKPLSLLEVEKEGIVVFYSLSKRNNMTGYRVGFVAGDEKIIEIFKKLKPNIDSGTPDFVQEAAIAALHDTEHNLAMRRLYAEKMKVLTDGLSEIGLEVKKPDATFYLWQKVPAGMTDLEFAKKLLDPNIAIVVTPGSLISDLCFDGSNPGEGYVRFALMPTLTEIHEAVKRLKSSSETQS